VVVKTGASKDRRLRRKPRLQVRLPEGLTPDLIRKALSLALTLEQQNQALRVDVETPTEAAPSDMSPSVAPPTEEERAPLAEPQDPTPDFRIDPELIQKLQHAEERLERLHDVVQTLQFNPLRDGVRTRSDALHVLGFAPHSRPNFDMVREQFRSLAKVYHPDSGFGDNHRMSQLNDALRVLRTGGL